MDGMTISNLCPGAFDPNSGCTVAQHSRCIGPILLLEVGDKPTALSKIEKDPQRCQTSQLMVLWTM